MSSVEETQIERTQKEVINNKNNAQKDANNDEESGEELEQEAVLVKKNLQPSTDDENNKNEIEDDKTEDQIPDIPIQEDENQPDPMTTSIDEIEDLPLNEDEEITNEADEQPNKENEDSEVPIEQKDVVPKDEAPIEEDVKEIPVEVYEELEEEAKEIKENNQVVEEPTTNKTDENEEFQLQDPPTPKRPRTPNELDITATEEDEENFVDANEVEKVAVVTSAPQTPKSPAKVSQPSTPAPNEEVFSRRSSKVGSVVGEEPAENRTGSRRSSKVGSAVGEPNDSGSRRSSKIGNAVGEPTDNNDSGSRRASKVGSIAGGVEAVENETGSRRSSKVASVVDEPIGNGSLGSRKSSKVSNIPSTPLIEDVPLTPKSPAASIRRSSNVSAPKSPMVNGSITAGSPVPTTPRSATVNAVSPAPTTPRSGAIASSPITPKSGTARGKFNFEESKKEEAPLTPRTPKRTTFTEEQQQEEEEEEETPIAVSPKRRISPRRKSPTKSPRSPKKSKQPSPEPEPEPVEEEEAEPVVEKEPTQEVEQPEPVEDVEVVEEVEAPEEQEEIPVEIENEEEEPEAEKQQVKEEEYGEEKVDDKISAPIRERVQSPSPPPSQRRAQQQRAERSPSPSVVRQTREPAPRDYKPYDQDTHRETVPPRLPTSTSFSSWVPPEPTTYKPLSPWVNSSNSYRNEYTTGLPPIPPTAYTSFFDDVVSTGPFSHSLYSTTRLLERSRSRTRERRTAMRQQRSASNFFRMNSQYPAPLRTRDYSTPPTTAISRVPSRAGSFISFLDYSNSKQYDLARNASRGSLYDSNQALSRSSSRGNIDYYLGAGRISRVDSYVNNLNSRYEWQVPSNYETYRSASRSQVGYSPANAYASYTNPVTHYYDYENGENIRKIRAFGQTSNRVRTAYEERIDNLQRSLSQERYERDRENNNNVYGVYEYSTKCFGALPFGGAAASDNCCHTNEITRSLYIGFVQGWMHGRKRAQKRYQQFEQQNKPWFQSAY